MADRQTEAVTYLWERLAEYAGRPVVYSRGATSLEITALKGSVLLQLSDPMGGARMLRTKDDYAVLSSSLGELGEPEEGDRVQDTGEGKAYEVLPPGSGEAAWKYTDGTHVIAWLHTKEVPL